MPNFVIESEDIISEVAEAVGKGFDRKGIIMALDDCENEWDPDEAVNLIISSNRKKGEREIILFLLCSNNLKYHFSDLRMNSEKLNKFFG